MVEGDKEERDQENGGEVQYRIVGVMAIELAFPVTPAPRGL